MFIDFHTHRCLHFTNCLEIVSVHRGKQIPGSFYTIGFHPWWQSTLLSEEQVLFLGNELKNNQGCLGIGECGLDKLKGSELKIQSGIFEQHISVANTFGCPLIIHCVRAFHEVLEYRKSNENSIWVVHGFVRNKTLAGQLLDKGIYLSVSPSAKMSTVFQETLSYLPLDRIFLETDSEKSLTIQERYSIFAGLRGIPLESLQKAMIDNLFTFYHWKENIIRNGLKGLNYS
jgi:TatD DNase family protein